MPRTKQFDKNEVLEKAMELFWKNGYHATSMGQLVQHLGINRASIYSTFNDKKDLFEQALRLYRQKNGGGVKSFLAAQKSVKEGFHNLFTSAIDEGVNDPESRGCFVVNITTELVPGDEDILPALNENQAHFVKLFKEFLERGVKEGEIAANKDLDATAQYLFTLYNGLRVVGKINKDQESLIKMIKVGLMVLN
jgi:TetR/AcrR family transcriptional repressor of nem operon